MLLKDASLSKFPNQVFFTERKKSNSIETLISDSVHFRFESRYKFVSR